MVFGPRVTVNFENAGKVLIDANAVRLAAEEVWARVQLARNLRRPRTLEFIAAMAWVDPPYDWAANFISDLGFADCAAAAPRILPP